MSKYNRLTPKMALQLAAPHTWPASICPALLAEVYCHIRGLRLSIWQDIFLLAACVLMQAAVNTINDYVDYVQGTDSSADNVEESDAVLVYRNINPNSALKLGVGFLAAGAALGILSSLPAGITPILIGCAGAAAVILYSGGPLPVSYLPIGELVSGFVMGGLIPLGVAACADNRLHPEILIFGLPCIIGIGLIMMSNNGCDIEKDIRAGRRTLPTLLGRERTKLLYHFLVMIWALLICILPVYMAGAAGLIGIVIFLLTAGRKFLFLVSSGLLPEGRIGQMKTITAANLLGNGAYTAALLIAAVAAGFLG